jgi:hypothetical protein
MSRTTLLAYESGRHIPHYVTLACAALMRPHYAALALILALSPAAVAERWTLAPDGHWQWVDADHGRWSLSWAGRWQALPVAGEP